MATTWDPPTSAAQAPATATLADLPSDVLAHILFLLMDEESRSALRCPGGLAAKVIKDAVAFCSTCHSIHSAQPIRQLMSLLALRPMHVGCQGETFPEDLATQLASFPLHSVMRKPLGIYLLDLEEWKHAVGSAPRDARCALACFKELDLWMLHETQNPSALSKSIREACHNVTAVSISDCDSHSALLPPLIPGLQTLEVSWIRAGEISRLLQQVDSSHLRCLIVGLEHEGAPADEDDSFCADLQHLAGSCAQVEELDLKAPNGVRNLQALVASCPRLTKLRTEYCNEQRGGLEPLQSKSLQHIAFCGGQWRENALVRLPLLAPEGLPALRDVELPDFRLCESAPMSALGEVVGAVSAQVRALVRMHELFILKEVRGMTFGSVLWEDGPIEEAALAADQFVQALHPMQGNLGGSVDLLNVEMYVTPSVVRQLLQIFPCVSRLNFKPSWEHGCELSNPAGCLTECLLGFQNLAELTILADASTADIVVACEAAQLSGRGVQLCVSFGNPRSAEAHKRAWEQRLLELQIVHPKVFLLSI